MNILEIKNLYKSYRRYNSNWHRLAGWLGNDLASPEQSAVLQDINLQVSRGEALGVLGNNGAGKSTLLKIVAGTLARTAGTMTCKGRIAAILELGMGFNPELSGRQNVIFAAGLMGFSKAEIDQKLPDIEAFAEVGEYFDRPVRTYSSGMQMRVAFAVATAWQPDLLVIDEALSVGDAYFQAKSFAKIKEFRARGSALILVSHDRNAILNVCDSAILLDGGRIVHKGPPQEVFEHYNALLSGDLVEVVRLDERESGNKSLRSSSGNRAAIFESVSVLNADGKIVDTICVGETVVFECQIAVKANLPKLVVGFGIHDRLGQVIFGTNTHLTNQVTHNLSKGDKLVAIIKFPANLGVGTYSLQLALTDRETHVDNNYHWIDHAAEFHVMNPNQPYFAGMIWADAKIAVTPLNKA